MKQEWLIKSKETLSMMSAHLNADVGLDEVAGTRLVEEVECNADQRVGETVERREAQDVVKEGC